MPETEVVTPPVVETPPVTWRDSLPDDLKAAPELAKYTDVAALAKGHLEQSKLVGRKVEGQFKVPDSTSTPEEKAAFRKAMQVPDTPEGYQYKRHAMMSHSEWNADAEKAFVKLFHEEGIPPKTAERLMHAYGDFMATQVKANEVIAAEARGELRAEWGVNYDTFLGAANRGLTRVEQAIGAAPGTLVEATKGADPAAVAKAFHWIESQFTEHGWVSGEPVRGMAPEAALARLSELQAQLAKVPEGSDEARVIIEHITQVGAALKRAA